MFPRRLAVVARAPMQRRYVGVGGYKPKTTLDMVKPPPIGGFARMIAWDEREIEFRAMENELERVKSGLNDAEWAAAAEDRIYNTRYKRGAPPSGETLVREVQQVVQWKPMTAEEKVAEAAKRRGNIGNRGSADSYVGQAAAMIANVGPGASNPVPAAQKEAAVEGNKKEEGGLKMV